MFWHGRISSDIASFFNVLEASDEGIFYVALCIHLMVYSIIG